MYQAVGFVVVKLGKWYLRRKLAPRRNVLAAGVVAVAITALVVAGRQAASD